MSDLKPDPNQVQTQDAQRLAEEIAAGDRPPIKVDVAADYEASKEFSMSEIDKAGKGAELAEAATAPQFEVPKPEETELKTEPTGDPSDFKAMAADVNPHAESTGNVDDDLVKKAIDLGQPG